MIACLHIPHFPAWAFGRELSAGAPLVVVERERVVAATVAARRKDVERGLPLERALTLVPDVEVRVRDTGLEEAVWEEALAEINRHTPYLEPVAIGTIYGRAAGTVWKELAERFGALVGLGPERATARLAAMRATAGRVLAIEPARRQAFLQSYHVDHLLALGFSEELPERLQLFGYTRLGMVASLTRRQLDAQFAAEGAALYDLLHPEAGPPILLYQPPPSLTAAVEFDFPCREPAELLPALEPLAEELGQELRRVVARRVTVRLEARGSSRSATRVLFEGATEPRRVLSAAQPLLLKLLEEGVEVDRLAIELGALRPASAAQGALFQDRPSVYVAARGVHRRFPGAIKRAVVVYAQFPEDRIQFEPFVEVRRAA